jgi:hypothetical protein
MNMSIVYECKLRTVVKESVTPLLYDFLNKAINTKEEPSSELFDKFNNPDLAELAFNFIRYSRCPELVWSEPYSDWDKEDISNSWYKHSKYNEADALIIRRYVDTTKSKLLGVLPKKDKVDLTRLSEIIGLYPTTSFIDGCLFITNEYSSNDQFSFKGLIEFLNANRNQEERMITAFESDDQVMPLVCLHINNGEIELFQGAYETSGFTSHPIQYDRNGFFCGSYRGRTENELATNDYGFIPPSELKYKIDWLDEDDVAMVKSGFEMY